VNHRILTLAVLTATPAGLAAQGTLDRSPNISGDWVVGPGTVQFNFLHRFIRSPKPVRKVTNFPTFLLATSVLKQTTVGFTYATNSTLAPAYPNEWEFFARAQPLGEAKGFPLDVGGQIAYNLAADGVDGELSVGRMVGPVRLLAVGRTLDNPATRGDRQYALGGGGAIKLMWYLAVHGDYVRLTKLKRAAGERGAWSVGLAAVIPGTPHTISLHATNANTGTIQGASRGDTQTRYGFEFTIPITLARYFGRRPQPAPTPSPAAPAAEAPGTVPTGPPGGAVFNSGMKALQFTDPTIEIEAGTTVQWTNNDPLIHTVTADDGGFDSGNLEAGQVWAFEFTRPGSYAFHCTTHPFMHGTVVVK
jgi:plastocyanin